MKNQSAIAYLPLTGGIERFYILSLIAALLIAGVSLAGLLAPDRLYPTPELLRSFVANDVVNLFIGLPILLGSMWLTSRGGLIALLFWPGALFYAMYNYIAYAVAMPYGLQVVIYLSLVALSAYSTFGLISRMDWAVIQDRLRGRVAARLGDGVLAGLGTLFLLRSVGQILSAIIGQTTLARSDLAMLVADLLTIPAWVVGGILLWQPRAGLCRGGGPAFLGQHTIHRF